MLNNSATQAAAAAVAATAEESSPGVASFMFLSLEPATGEAAPDWREVLATCLDDASSLASALGLERRWRVEDSWGSSRRLTRFSELVRSVDLSRGRGLGMPTLSPRAASSRATGPAAAFGTNVVAVTAPKASTREQRQIAIEILDSFIPTRQSDTVILDPIVIMKTALRFDKGILQIAAVQAYCRHRCRNGRAGLC